MKKITDIFSKDELDYLSRERPDLVPMEVPSIEENILTIPSLDQVISKFLKKYDVKIEPRNVGEWNGWDTVSTIGSFFAKDYSISTTRIADTMFYANRSNQINSAAQEWNTWKRWVFDTKEKEFNKFNDELVRSINLHNQKVKNENSELIKIAELNNQKISKELAKPPAKNYIAELVKQRKLKEIENKKNAKSFLLITFCTLLFFNVLGRCTSNFNKNRKKSELKLLICRTPKKDLGICYARDEVNIL